MPDNSTILLFADIADSVGLYEAVGDATAKGIVVELHTTGIVKSVNG